MGKLRSTLQRWRLALLCVLLAISLGMVVVLAITEPSDSQPLGPFVGLWLACFLPYIAACLLVLGTREQTGRTRWIELAVIMGGTLLLSILFLGKDPNLSRDSWRYLWDARVTLHGYSPYVYGPGDPKLLSLRDFLYDNSRFRNVPTLYPPFAEFVYLLSYLVAPANLAVLKSIFVGCDLLICGLLILALQKKGLDPARCILYAWCPLPIIEFALQGHVDVVAVLLTVGAILSAQSQKRGARALTGLCIALATLVKIYPILLLLVVWRRRDWVLLLTCFGTIILAYIPYIILGHGQVLGFFGTYAGESSGNGGPVSLTARWLWLHVGLNGRLAGLFVYGVDALFMGSVALLVFVLRQREQMGMEVSTLILVGAIFAISPHIFPWYTTALLVWIALVWRPLRTKSGRLDAGGLASVLAWYFPCATIGSYFLLGPHPNWTWYYVLVYGLTCVGLGVAIFLWRKQREKKMGEVSL
ncbi:MAG TPA: glycosyltransferase family 87 protein [Ktedonobacteraceae bacterium]|jgi:hypothetical protein|nr:glycosyltransferase family 87 protein [Ktedonobacteraceae bacterium]